MRISIDSSTHPPSVTATPATPRVAPAAAPKAAPISSASVSISNAAQMAAKEAAETPAQTAQEARGNDNQAKRLLSRETAARKAYA